MTRNASIELRDVELIFRADPFPSFHATSEEHPEAHGREEPTRSQDRVQTFIENFFLSLEVSVTNLMLRVHMPSSTPFVVQICIPKWVYRNAAHTPLHILEKECVMRRWRIHVLSQEASHTSSAENIFDFDEYYDMGGIVCRGGEQQDDMVSFRLHRKEDGSLQHADVLFTFCGICVDVTPRIYTLLQSVHLFAADVDLTGQRKGPSIPSHQLPEHAPMQSLEEQDYEMMEQLLDHMNRDSGDDSDILRDSWGPGAGYPSSEDSLLYHSALGDLGKSLVGETDVSTWNVHANIASIQVNIGTNDGQSSLHLEMHTILGMLLSNGHVRFQIQHVQVQEHVHMDPPTAHQTVLTCHPLEPEQSMRSSLGPAPLFFQKDVVPHVDCDIHISTEERSVQVRGHCLPLTCHWDPTMMARWSTILPLSPASPEPSKEASTGWNKDVIWTVDTLSLHIGTGASWYVDTLHHDLSLRCKIQHLRVSSTLFSDASNIRKLSIDLDTCELSLLETKMDGETSMEPFCMLSAQHPQSAATQWQTAIDVTLCTQQIDDTKRTMDHRMVLSESVDVPVTPGPFSDRRLFLQDGREVHLPSNPSMSSYQEFKQCSVEASSIAVHVLLFQARAFLTQSMMHRLQAFVSALTMVLGAQEKTSLPRVSLEVSLEKGELTFAEDHAKIDDTMRRFTFSLERLTFLHVSNLNGNEKTQQVVCIYKGTCIQSIELSEESVSIPTVTVLQGMQDQTYPLCLAVESCQEERILSIQLSHLKHDVDDAGSTFARLSAFFTDPSTLSKLQAEDLALLTQCVGEDPASTHLALLFQNVEIALPYRDATGMQCVIQEAKMLADFTDAPDATQWFTWYVSHAQFSLDLETSMIPFVHVNYADIRVEVGETTGITYAHDTCDVTLSVPIMEALRVFQVRCQTLFPSERTDPPLDPPRWDTPDVWQAERTPSPQVSLDASDPPLFSTGLFEQYSGSQSISRGATPSPDANKEYAARLLVPLRDVTILEEYVSDTLESREEDVDRVQEPYATHSQLSVYVSPCVIRCTLSAEDRPYTLVCEVRGVQGRFDQLSETQDTYLQQWRLALSIEDLYIFEYAHGVEHKPPMLQPDALCARDPRTPAAVFLSVEQVHPCMLSRHPERVDLASTARVGSEIRVLVRMVPWHCSLRQPALQFLLDHWPHTDVPADPHPSFLFFQQVDISEVQVRIDYSPTKVDISELRKGRLVQLLNVFPIEGARVRLPSVQMHGIEGWASLQQTAVEAYWPSLGASTLSGVVGNVHPLRPLARIGRGAVNLVLMPIDQYRKDGSVLHGMRLGGQSFLRSVVSEVLQLTSTLASETSVILDHADDWFSGQARPGSTDESPTGTRDAVQTSLGHITRDIQSTAETIIAIPLEMEGEGLSRHVLRAVPIAIFRPLAGITRAVGDVASGIAKDIAN